MAGLMSRIQPEVRNGLRACLLCIALAIGAAAATPYTALAQGNGAERKNPASSEDDPSAVIVESDREKIGPPKSTERAGALPNGASSMKYSRDPSTVIVRFAQNVTAIEDPDPGPSLRVFGDGRVEVHYPRYMRRAGDYTLQLTPGEMNALLRSLVSRGIMEFDDTATRSRKRSIQARAGHFAATYDAVTTEIEIRLEDYRRPAGSGRNRRIHKRVNWPALRSDAKRHPQIDEIQDLAASQRELLSLMRRPDLIKVK
jgi:hypothetical protein